MANNYNIRVLSRALSALHLFDSSRKSISLMEFSELLELNKSTMFRILRNLRGAGFLDMDVNGRFVLGPEIARLGKLASPGGDASLKRAAAGALKSLAALSGETVFLGKYENGRMTCVDKVESNKALKITSVVGENIPLLFGATGKSVAAFLPPDELSRCIETQEFLAGAPCNHDALYASLRDIRARGYSVTSNELDEGVTALAAPIRRKNGRIAGSITIAGPSSRLDDRFLSGFIDDFLQIAASVSEKLGFAKPEE